MSQVEDIARIVGWERSRGFTVDWQVIESDMGTVLPQDYKELAEHFGPGGFDPFFTLLVPGVANPAVEIRRNLARWQKVDEDYRGRSKKVTPFPHFPHPGGLIPWGNSEHGEIYYWRTVGKPDEWPVLVAPAVGQDFYEYQGGITDFLRDLFTDRLDIPFLPSLAQLSEEAELNPDIDIDEVEEVRPEFLPYDGSWPYEGALPVIACFESDGFGD
ncbi:SMI1/KNR4 family protein [Streptomyces sp. TR1341]|uniref:SMI1/KNR4 family protein n=1 Tax=Streptomyces sp. TR1341 TaxID=2601266 RepID=UPI00138ADFAB|nr:SMI1/KNR4 family protein [Streptomyces sp. TR1341]